jgi:hypothetical protein
MVGFEFGWEADRTICRAMQIYKIYNTTLLRRLPASDNHKILRPTKKTRKL